MLFHSKCRLREPVIVTEVFREDWSFIGKRLWRENKFPAIVYAVRFIDGDILQEEYMVYRIVEKKGRWDDWRYNFIRNENWYPSNFVSKVDDILYSYEGKFKFLSESVNNIRWTNPDKKLAQSLQAMFPKEDLLQLKEDLKCII